MNIAESSLDNVDDFETNLDCFHLKHSIEKCNGTTKDMMDTKDTFVRYTIILYIIDQYF